MSGVVATSGKGSIEMVAVILESSVGMTNHPYGLYIYFFFLQLFRKNSYFIPEFIPTYQMCPIFIDF